MAFKCDLKQRQCVVWEIEKPFLDRPRVSPVFSLMNSEWFLKIRFVHAYSMCYAIDLIKIGGPTTFPQISITTYLEDSRSGVGPVLSERQNISASVTDKVLLWSKYSSEILKYIPSFENHGDFTIVCVFHTSVGADVVRTKKTTEHKEIQVSLDLSSDLGSTSSADNTSGLTYKLPPTFSDCSFDLENLSQDLRNLLDKHILPDVKLRVGGHTILVHKAVLAARSEVFLAMFQNKMSESSSGVVDIKDIDPPVLDAFLKFLYSGKILEDLSEDMVFKLYSASDKYAVSSLSKICSEFIAENLREENFLQVLVLADAHNDRELKEAVARFVNKNDRLLTSDIWDTFSDEYPKLAIEIYRMHFAKSVSKRKS